MDRFFCHCSSNIQSGFDAVLVFVSVTSVCVWACEKITFQVAKCLNVLFIVIAPQA